MKILILFVSVFSLQIGACQHSVSCPSEAHASEAYLSDTRPGTFLITCGRTVHTISRYSAQTPYSAQCHQALLPLKICVNWKGSDQRFSRESEAESEREGKRSTGDFSLWTQLLQSAQSQSVHHSLKACSLSLIIITELWNSRCNNCLKT